MMDEVNAGLIGGRSVDALQNRIMSRFDKDGSGDVSIAEAGDFGRMARSFTRIDQDDNGVLSQDEIYSHATDRLERRAEREMQSAQMNAMAAWMNEQQVDDGKVAAFEAIDTDANGMLSDAELAVAADTARAAEEAAQMRAAKVAEITRMDLDGDGQLSANELQAELDMRAATQAEAQAAAAFDGLDTDMDGMLSDAELMAGIAGQMSDDAMPSEMADMGAAGTTMADAAMPMSDPADMGMMDGDAVMSDTMTDMPNSDMASASDDAMMGNDVDTLSLIENVFEDMLDDRGQSVSMASLTSMSHSLYAQAQEILINQLETAAEFVGESDSQDEDQTVSV